MSENWNGVPEAAAFVETLIGELLGVVEHNLPKELPESVADEKQHYVINALMWVAAQYIFRVGPVALKYAVTALSHSLADTVNQGTAIDSELLKTATTRCFKVTGDGTALDTLDLGAPVVTDKMQIN